ncbi:MAG: cell division protein, partial [Microbacterium sp.]
MRRPSPLPQPAAQRPAEPGPTGLRRDQPAAPADVVSEVDPDEHPTAPIIPITAPITLTPGRPAPLPGSPAASPAADADAAAEPAEDPAPAEPVRLGEVWAAARARRKALRAEVRRFTVRQRRRRAVWIGAAASVVIL